MTAEQEVERGRAAQRIVNVPIFIEAWEMADRQFYEFWRNVDWRDEKAMQAMKRVQTAAFHFRSMLEQIINTGAIAEEEIRRFHEDD